MCRFFRRPSPQVAKPTALFEEPWISETMRDALERKLAATKDEPLRSMEAFPILVVGRVGKAVATIEAVK